MLTYTCPAHAQTCTTCGAVIEKATGHKFVSEVMPATCEDMGYTTYTCENCGVSYKSDYTKILGHDYVPVVTAPTCTEGGFTTYTCSRCGGAYECDYTEPAGHKFDAGTKVIDSTCNGEGMIEYNCENCEYHYQDADAFLDLLHRHNVTLFSIDEGLELPPHQKLHIALPTSL